MTSPPHAWTATGQSPEALSTDDTRKEHPRNPAVVGPPVPRQATLPAGTPTQPQSKEPATEQPAPEQPKADQPNTTDQ
jgi:hypothetical protein